MVGRAMGLWVSCDPWGALGSGVTLSLHLLCCLCCRSCRSPSQSWCSRRRAAARTEYSTQVRGHGAGQGSWGHGGPGPAQWELLGTGRAAGAYRDSIFLLSGKKQDTWFIVDPKSGEKQTTLSTEAWDGLCPSSPLLYIGRTRKPVPCPHRLPGARNGVLKVT